MTKRRITTARLMLFVGLIALLLGGIRFYRNMTKDLEQDAWIGWSVDALKARLGPPDRIYPGDTVLMNYFRKTPEGATTLYYKTRRGHLCLYMKPGAAGGVCYGSEWFRDGIFPLLQDSVQPP